MNSTVALCMYLVGVALFLLAKMDAHPSTKRSAILIVGLLVMGAGLATLIAVLPDKAGGP